ncbi:MAG: hypothetical protein H0V01_04385 [Bacteroidetes bacterium]|nr:hypothetical protein [Bacteroidota bacterium]HET6243889.1 hypothetical protein [Bacteroidia bacterium]
MALLTKKIKASTLIEVIVALIIVMITFGIAMVIFINVTHSDNQVQKLKASLILNESALKTSKENSYIDEKTEVDGLFINKTINPYENIPGLNLVLFEAFDVNGKIIAERRELILLK